MRKQFLIPVLVGTFALSAALAFAEEPCIFEHGTGLMRENFQHFERSTFRTLIVIRPIQRHQTE